MWLTRGVDAVRLDAVKHMNTSFTTSLVSDMQNRLGRDIYFFGEWMDAGAWATGLNASCQDFANNSGSALLDFGYRSTIENVLKNSATMRTLGSYLQARESYWNEPLKQVVFLDNHDMPRINTVLRSGGMSEQDAATRTNIGLAITMTIRGVPCIYYGTEQYAVNFSTNSFGQVGSDPYNREMMPSFNEQTNAYNIIKTLSDLRQTNTALQCGSYAEKWVDNTVLAYERQQGGDAVFVIANKGNTRTMSIPNLHFANGVYENLIGNDTVAISGGVATVAVPENAVIVISSSESQSSGTFTIQLIAGSNAENVSFPCDANNWSLTANSVSVGAGQTATVVFAGGVTSETISRGDDVSKLELKLVTNASWSNQWSFANWTKSDNISLSDGNRQIAIACNAGDNATLTVDVSRLSLIASVE